MGVITRALVLAALGAALSVVPSLAAENLAAARLLRSELGSEFWNLTARFESGEHLMVEVCVTNVGLGDGNAAVIGHLVEADGTVHAFDGAKAAGEWSLSDDRLQLVLGKLELDQRGPVHRLRLLKERMGIDLAFRATGEHVRLAGAEDKRGFELLGVESEVAGRIWTENGGERSVRGRLLRTHRWAEGLESSFVLRRIELFTLDGETGVYLVEALDPSGGTQSWLRIQRGEEALSAVPVTTRVVWAEDAGPPGFPLPQAVEIEGEGVRGRFLLANDLVRYDPLRDLPAAVRWGLAPFIRWRTAWSAGSFELQLGADAGGPLQLRGRGMSNVTYFNAVSEAQSVASPPAEVTCGSEC